MSKQKETSELQHELENVQIALTRAEQWIEKNRKPLLIGLAVVVIIVGGYFGLKYGYIIPKEKKAEAAMFTAEQAFVARNFQVALDGDGANLGFKAIVDEYSMTKSANLAKAYAGLCLKELGKYEEAIDYLKGFDSDDELIAPAIIGATGDCYVELDQVEKGISYFEKAAKKANNDLLSPIYLKKAGIAYESLGEYKKAVSAYETIKEKYYMSQEAADIEKFIDRANDLAAAK